MIKNPDIQEELQRIKLKRQQSGEGAVQEANRVLNKDLFTENKILENLIQYNDLSHILEEENLERERIFSIAEIKQICTDFRLKFLSSKSYKPVIPYQSVLMIKELNRLFGKELQEFRILATAGGFEKKENVEEAILFVKTNHDNYYLLNRWGQPLKWYRKLLYWPMRNFENLFLTVVVTTLCIVLSLPTWLITLDHKAEYWSGYRAAAFFHILIFNMGVTAYVTFAFAKNFSSTVWNREQDF